MSMRLFNRSFSGGEITPELFGRLDLSKVQEALSLCMNFITLPHGPVVNRPGTEFVEEVKSSANATRVIPFTYSNTQAFAIQLGAGYFRFHANGATLQIASAAWSGATSYNPNDLVIAGGTTYACVAANTNNNPVAAAWSNGTPYTAGTLVSYNGVTYLCINGNTNSAPPNGNWSALWRPLPWWSTTYTYQIGDLAWSGGVVYYCTASNINNAPPNAAYWSALPANGDYEIPNPYAAPDLMDIHYTQSADVMTLVHPNYPIMELRRYGANCWKLLPVSFAPKIPAPFAASAIGTPITHTYAVMAICYFPGGSNFFPSGPYPSTLILGAGCTNDLTQQGAYNIVSWSSVQFATSYNVYKLIGSNYYYIGSPQGNSIRDDASVVYTAQGPMPTAVIVGGVPYPGPATITPSPYNPSATNAVTVTPTGTGSTSYSYQVTALDDGNNESYPSATAICINDLTSGTNKNTVTFPAVAGAIRYNIYKLSSGIFGFIGQAAPSPRTGTFSRATTTITCTITAHGLTNGQSCPFYFSDTSFGAPPGGTSYPVTVVDANTFTITVANAGAASGTVTQLGGAGLSFVDNNITADISRTPPLAPGNVLQGTGNYPSAVAYYQQRRLFAATSNQPQNVWATRSGTESDMGYTIPTRDDNRIAFKIAARDASAIRHIVPLQDMLFLSASCEWKCSSTTGVLTPTTINVQPQSYVGANNVTPVVVGNAALYAAARGGHIRQINYNWQINGYQTTDSSIFAPHLFDYNTIQDMAYSRGPIPILWCVSSSGKLLGMTYLPEQQIAAWHQHTTGANDVFESICTISENNEDMLYCIVRRTMSSGGIPVTKRFVERLHTRLYNTVADCHYVDCGTTYTYNSSSSNYKSGAYASSGTAALTCTIANHGLTNGQTYWFYFSNSTYGSLPGGLSYQVTVVDANTFTISVTNSGTDSGTVIWLPNIITGLSWLNGMTVNILADGAVVPPQTVTNGAITLPVGVTQVHVGLPITAQLQTPPASQAVDPAMAQGLAKNVNKAFLRTYRSSGILAGPDFADLTPYRQRSTENPGSPPNLVSDEIEILLTPDWGTSGQICIQQSDPLPLDIASMTLEIAVGGGV